MSDRNLCADFIRAMACSNDAACAVLSDEMERAGTTAEFFGAVFYVLVRRRFQADGPHGEIIRFVASMRMNFDPTGDEIDPAATESLLHLALDTDTLDPGLDPRLTVELELLLIRRLLDDAELSDEQLSGVFREAEAYLDRVTAPDDFQRSVERIAAARRIWND